MLEKIAASPLVASVIPGRIRVSQGVTSIPRLKIQIETLSGLKLSARSGNAVQEVFVVTSEPARVRRFLTDEVPELDKSCIEKTSPPQSRKGAE